MQKSFSLRDILSALAVVVIWGLNFVAMKFALHDFTPFQLGAARYVVAFLPLALFIKPPQLPWKWLVLYGLFQGVGQFGFLFWALQVGMTAALASVLMQTQVFFTALWSLLLMREKLSRTQAIGLVLAGLGLLCFSMNYVQVDINGLVHIGEAGANSATTLAGFALNLCAAAMWAVSNLVARKAQQANNNFNPVAFVVWCSWVPIAPFVLMSYWFDPQASQLRWLDAAPSSWLAIAYLGVIATVAAYALWTGLLKRHPANRVAPFSLGVPVVGLLAGMGMLGEQMAAWHWAGIAFIVSALVWVMLSERWASIRKKAAQDMA